MDIKKYISNNYPTVKPFDGIRSVEDELLEYKYLVVIDNDNKFHGILTTSDIIRHPHKIVIDCITKKESVTMDDTIVSTLEKFYSNQSLVLPVMKGSDFIGIIEKNQILRGLEVKVNELYDKSLISEKAKKLFLNNLSHEIRTPLNGMLGFIDIVAQLNANDIEIKDESFSKSIQKSAANFLLIMSDLVELSFLHAGEEISVQKDNVDIIKIFTELKDYFYELSSLQNRKLTIVFSHSESSFYIYTDGKKLKHILYHLINNAIKFSEDSKITFGFELIPLEKNISLYVKNKNSGIDKKNMQKMFDVFEKQENIGNELNSGLGIGLPLVKSLTELLGGHVSMEIENNEISFFVKIPIEDNSGNAMWN